MTEPARGGGATPDRKPGGGGWRALKWGALGLAFLAPLAAQALTPQMNWGVFDFVLFGAMLAAAGLAGEAIVRRVRRPLHRAIGGLLVAAVFLLVWAELAVGVF